MPSRYSIRYIKLTTRLQWFDRQKSYLDSLETQLRGLVKSIDVVAKQRADIAAAAGEFAQTIADLAACDVGNQLSDSLSGLAEVERKVQELQLIQSHEDVVSVLSTGPCLLSDS